MLSQPLVSPVIKELAIRATTASLAHALSERPGLVVLASDRRGALSPADARFSFVACEPKAVSHDLVPDAGAGRGGRDPVARGWGGFPAAPRWVGVLPYEAMRGLERPTWTTNPLRRDARPLPTLSRPVWLKYAAVARVDHESGQVVLEADDLGEARHLESALRSGPQAQRDFALQPLDESEAPDAHVARVRKVLDLIARGDVYQVNLARRISFGFRGDAVSLFTSLAKRAPSPYSFYADFGGVRICASSPELALEVRRDVRGAASAWSPRGGDRLRTAPIKGTRPRGTDATTDAALARELSADPKERAELTMALDLHRNDLGKVAEIGSVRVLGEPRLLAGRTVWSRVAEVVARRAAGVSDADVVRAMLPCGSVTGAPKVRAMEVIASLEPFRRGVYTGAFGYVGRDGALVLAMAIRTLEIEQHGATYFTGGGIVADSDPQRELEETRWKASQLVGLTAHPTQGLGAVDV